MGRKSRAKKEKKLGISSLDGSSKKLDKVTYKWDTLIEEYEHTANDIVTQLSLCDELCKLYGDPLSKNPELNNTVIGLIKTYQDLADDVLKHSEQHKENGQWKRGTIDENDVDSIMYFINILGMYTAIQERIARLASRGYLDIVTQIMSNPEFQNDEILANAKETLAAFANVDLLKNVPNDIKG